MPNTIEEELFCTRYELDTLSGIVNLGMLERWIPGYCGVHTHREHIARYNWVKQFVENKIVADLACGSGFGSLTLANDGKASIVYAGDIDSRTVKYASIKNKHQNINFAVKNGEDFELAEEVEVFVSFETIEHLSNPNKFLENVQKSIKKNGQFVVSTPISNIPINNNPENIHHRIEWGFLQFQELVNNYFTIKEVYLQLYKHPKPLSNKLINRGLRKLIPQPIKEKLIERIEPFKWVESEIPVSELGNSWTGYQILICELKF